MEKRKKLQETEKITAAGWCGDAGFHANSYGLIRRIRRARKTGTDTRALVYADSYGEYGKTKTGFLRSGPRPDASCYTKF